MYIVTLKLLHILNKDNIYYLNACCTPGTGEDVTYIVFLILPQPYKVKSVPR